MSTFCIHTMHNVEEGRRDAENSTFCITLPGFPSMPQLTFAAQRSGAPYQR
jgi:hypothetical protein